MLSYLLTAQETDGNSGGNWTLLIILGVFIIGMLAFSIIPQRRKQKQMAEMNSRIKVGDKIKTIGGIFGTIVDFDQENNLFTILSGNSTFEIDRGCVYSMEMMGAQAAPTASAAPAEAKEEVSANDTEKAACEKLAQNAEKVAEQQEKTEEKESKE